MTENHERRSRGARFTEENVCQLLEFFPGLACCCRDGIIVTMNTLGARFLGYDAAVLLEGRPFDELLAPEYAGIGLIEQVLEDAMPCLAMFVRADDSRIGAEINIQNARELGSGTMIIMAEDVSHRTALGSYVRDTEMRFRSLIDNATDLICSFSGGIITFINHSGLAMLGARSAKEVIAKPITSMFHEDYHQVFEDPEALTCLVEEEGLFPARLKRIDGSCLDVQVSLSPTEDGNGFMLEARDITEHRNAVMALHQINQELEQRVRDRTRELSEEVTRRAEAEERMRQMATHDGLTGLPNRQLFMDRLDHAIQRGHRYGSKTAVLFIDLDAFKEINDTHGHGAGDMLLKEVASRLLAQVRKTDTVGRIGGDEFVINYTDLGGVAEVKSLAARILRSLAVPFALPAGAEGLIGGSIGIALCPGDGADAYGVMKAADEAMYKVKKRGKNHFLMACDLD
ncbi:MAG: diguanylate cyclase [Rhodospirillales bacterium]